MIKYTLFKTNQFKRSYKKQKLTDSEDVLKLVDIGSHSDLFE